MFNRRLIIFFLILTIFFAIILVRLVDLQVYAHEKYLEDVQQLLLRPAVLLPSVRGQIFDRNGQPLAANEPCFNLGIHYGAVALDEKYIKRLAKSRARAFLGRTPKKDEYLPYISRIKNEIEDMWLNLPTRLNQPEKLIHGRRQSAKERINRIRSKVKSTLQDRLPKADNWLETAQSESSRERINSLVLREEYSFIPIAFYLPNDTARRIQSDLGSPEWITLIPTARRVYPKGYVAAQIIGTIGSVTKENLDSFADTPAKSYRQDSLRGYAPEGDIIGRTGVEKGYDWSTLRGSRGLQQKDSDGNLVLGENLAPIAGQDLHLTIDIELQADLEKALAEGSKDSPAAAVVIDIATGEVLAMASTPLLGRADSIPPFSVKGDYPWMNRCVEAIYPPGSTVKPAVILAGLSPRFRGSDFQSAPPVINPNTVYDCPTRGPGRFLKPRCRGHNHGSIRPDSAITESCNVYCATVAERLSWDLLVAFTNVGLARPTNLHLPHENPGMIPGGTQSTGGPLRKLSAAELRQMGIGQGLIAVTPLQVANMMATIARGGVYVPPSLTGEQSKNAGSIDLEADPEHIKLVIDAMEAVVHQSGGTAYKISELRETGLRIAGKTGTAEYNQYIKDDWRCWFAGFAPVGDPQIAFAVVVEHGDSGAKVAGPRAAELLKLCIKHGYIKTASTAELSLESSSPGRPNNHLGEKHEPF